MKGRIVVAFLFVVLASAGVGLLGGMVAGEPSSCCSDRAVLLKGMYAAHYELVQGNPDEAKRILKETAQAVGVDE